MARVTVSGDGRQIDDPHAIADFLAPYGIRYEKWEVEGRLSESPSSEEILAAYGPEIERLKQRGGYVTADVINVRPDTPGLDEMLAKFDKEHTHSEDEVRFVVHGRGLFHIHPAEGPVFAIEVESGDLINVPRGTKHWFDFCENRTIRCIRLFEDMSGWTPHYVEAGVHEDYAPLCLGPAYFPVQSTIEPVVKP